VWNEKSYAQLKLVATPRSEEWFTGTEKDYADTYDRDRFLLERADGRPSLWLDSGNLQIWPGGRYEANRERADQEHLALLGYRVPTIKK
jgi:hypothetical protein